MLFPVLEEKLSTNMKIKAYKQQIYIELETFVSLPVS